MTKGSLPIFFCLYYNMCGEEGKTGFSASEDPRGHAGRLQRLPPIPDSKGIHICLRLFLRIVERNDERERIRRCEICRFLLGEVVRPQDEGGATGFVVGLCLAIAVKTAGHEDGELRMAVDELAALRLGKLGIRQEIDVPSFQRRLIPRPENIEGAAQDLFVGKIAPMPDAKPLVTKLGGHVNGVCLAKGLIEEHRHR